ncbi:MAG: S8 family serine peptidase [Candidatus Thermoplasmatota archaeon]|nr:S8 family serine peptidase [Candidatus Thermoplasmatota archaeon]
MRSRSIVAVIVTIVLTLVSVFAVLDLSAEGRPDEIPFGLDMEYWYQGLEHTSTEMDPSVIRAIGTEGPDEELEVIIQFQPPISEQDMEAVKDAGFEVLRVSSVLPAIYAKGDREAIESIARYPDTLWIEHNFEMEFLMEMTTTVINATKVWNSPIVDSVGKEYPAIDGQGVTVVVLDSGIDAGHPDLDYGEKVIKNYKSDSDGVWREVENGDTSSGHGTHCAGTVAGNGDASAGARAGVAVGAKLIGLSTGEAVSIFNAVGALEWVYEHSKPGHTYEWDDPIRVVSNSWGPGPGDYDPQDTISILSQKLTFENNVLIIFAASNSGGDGTDIQTNPYGNVPSNIAIAAFERDGSGVASFSSRGQVGILTTYPDVGAPGVSIWSTAARRTFISMMTKQSAGGLSNIDPYYFAISGTSMATPHIAGVTALILQAYPGLRMSDIYEEAEQAKLDAGWQNDSRNRVHEVELILEASARYVQPSDGNEPLASNNIPQNYSIGWNGEPFDLSQGFGLVQVDRAIGIALTLKELRERDFDGDGRADNPDICVLHAIEQYDGTMKVREKTVSTNKLYSAWNGEWSRFSNQTNQIIPMNHDTSKMVYIPETASELEVRFTFDPWNTDEKSVVSLFATIDWDGDGNSDWTQTGSPLQDARFDVISLSGLPTGNYWSFNVQGQGIDWNLGERFRETQYKEVRAEFTMSLNLSFPEGDFIIPPQDYHAQFAYWKPFGDRVEGTNINLTEYYYDLGEVRDPNAGEEPPEKEGGLGWLLIFLVLVVLAAVAVVVYFKRTQLKGMLDNMRKKGKVQMKERAVSSPSG